MTVRLLAGRGPRAAGGPGSPGSSGPTATRPRVGIGAVVDRGLTADRIVADVLRETDRGLTADRIAATLGVSEDVVVLALEHAERIGLVVRAAGGSPCRTGCPTGPDKPLGCYGCPFAR